MNSQNTILKTGISLRGNFKIINYLVFQLIPYSYFNVIAGFINEALIA
jgi:hypothetical protein